MQNNHDYSFYLAKVEDALQRHTAVIWNPSSTVAQAASYSLLNGGKRIRGVLVLAVCDLFHGDLEQASYYAAAIEMLHAYSLVHDDLPCMDNDDFRRGKPACHKAFGETTALLAGDALLTGAFQVLSLSGLSAQQNCAATSMLSNCAGTNGMIYGQELDLKFEGKEILTEDELNAVHKNKTGALIHASVQLGAIAANASMGKRTILKDFAYKLGLVFQIVDDMLDVTSTEEELGKPIGSDAQQGKYTFVSLKGLSGCEKLCEILTNEAIALLTTHFGSDADFLVSFSTKLSKRKH